MSADTQQLPQDADLPPPPQQPPPSSPIDGFGSPSLLILPPPVNRTSRSQSSKHTPRLELVSSSSADRAPSAQSSTMPPQRPPNDDDEVDELDDEFDAHTPLDLDICDRIEAESLRTANQRTQQSIIPAVTRSNSSQGGTSGSGNVAVSGTSNISNTNTRSSQKRKRTSPVVGTQDVIDLRETSPEPSTQPRKRARSQNSADNGGPITPYFREPLVRKLLADHNGVRAPSPIELPPVFTATQPPSQQRAAPRLNRTRAIAGINAATSSSSATVSAAAKTSRHSSSSDEDIPLAASVRASLAAVTESATRNAAFAQVISAFWTSRRRARKRSTF